MCEANCLPFALPASAAVVWGDGRWKESRVEEKGRGKVWRGKGCNQIETWRNCSRKKRELLAAGWVKAERERPIAVAADASRPSIVHPFLSIQLIEQRAVKSDS
jgi:hypothetical protein